MKLRKAHVIWKKGELAENPARSARAQRLARGSLSIKSPPLAAVQAAQEGESLQ